MKPGVEPLLSHLVISRKRGAEVVLPYCDELKVVLPGDADNPWTSDELHALANRLSPLDCFVQPQDPIDPRYVQVTLLMGNGLIPEASSYADNLKACIAHIKRYPYWRLGVQVHKIVGLP
jgi:organic radical activating enzyme